MATSEFAEQLFKSIDYELPVDKYKQLIDESLQEVREVVGLAAHPKFNTDDRGGIRYYLTKSDVERARELMSRLEVK